MAAFRPYQAISALAGSGKTYQLTTRYIGLLARGVPPERILAITFTRKAAGEIFDRIVNRLAGAALHDAARLDLQAALRDVLGKPRFDLTARRAEEWLRSLLDAMPRLRIGTIDSLFVSIVQAFALELGLPPRQEIIDGAVLDAAREEALRRAMESAARDPAAREGFLEAFKHATAGERKNVRDVILDLAHAGHELRLDVPEEDAWGVRDRLWPARPWWASGRAPDHEDLCRRLEAFRERHAVKQNVRNYAENWDRIIQGLRRQDWAEAADSLLVPRLVDRRDDLAAGRAEIEFGRKKIALAGRDADDALAAVSAIVRGEIEGRLEETAGRYRLLSAYEKAYDEAVRSRGRLAFSDVPVVLGRARDAQVPLDIDYRLDGQFDHWMLDEFQDTSVRQWKVIGNLADEILQSTEADRSFFYVGDVKQAIYAWRGGDSTLFEAVREYYEDRFGETFDVLDTSWRSSPVVLEAVNEIFRDFNRVERIREEHPEAARRWAKNWQVHRAAPKNARKPGRVEWIEVEPEEGDRDGAVARIGMTERIVKDLKRRGVPSVAVLVRFNSFGDTIADVLRREGLDVRRETSPALLDNAVVSALLSLLRVAEHPGDGFAWRHVEMTPLPGVLREWAGLPTRPPARAGGVRSILAERLRDAAARQGVAGLLGDLLDRCRAGGFLGDAFVDMRLRQLLDAALDYDRDVGGGPADFAAHAAGLAVNDPVVAGGVTVMTIHKAKGLEFDAVVLPELQGSRRQLTYLESEELRVGRPPSGGNGKEPANPADGDDDGRWVFPLPGEKLAALDPVLRDFRHGAAGGKLYEELCLFYVAATRAKQGLYFVTAPPAKSGASIYAETLLRETLGESEAGRRDGDGVCGRILHASGEADWFEKTPREAEDVGAAAPAAFKPHRRGKTGLRRRLMSRTPSGDEAVTARPPAETLFGAGKSKGSERGSLLHDLFERVEWYRSGAAEQVAATWEREQGGTAGADWPEVRAEFVRALESEEFRAALSRPSDRAEAWREQAFELADGDTWVTGRMDRVVVERDASGRVERAEVLDFKSDRVPDAAALKARIDMYRPQIEWYVRALSRLLKIPPARIRARLAFTQTGKVVGLPISDCRIPITE